MWHSQEPQTYLVKYLDLLKGGKEKMRILLPLCGKAGDIMWLYNQGHTIVGVEGVANVVQEYFQENNLEFDKSEVKEIQGYKFQSKDGRIIIFACDMFKITKNQLGHIDAVYDRGALEAINVEDRDQYVNIMKSSLQGKDFRYLLHGFEYDITKFQGPPRALHKDLIRDMFGDFCDVSVLFEDTNVEYKKAFNLDELVQVIYLLKPKK